MIRSFVKDIKVWPGMAVTRYTIPASEHSSISGMDTEALALRKSDAILQPRMVELRGFEPLTSAVQERRSPN